MSNDSVASRYAQALLSLALEAQKLDVVQANAKNFLDVLETSKDLSIALSHPNVQLAQRRAIINAVLEKSDYDRLFINFTKLLVDRGRIQIFAKIYESILSQRDVAEGRVRALLISAQPVTEKQRQALKLKIETQMKCEVVFVEQIDPSIIGGVRLVIGDRVYDNSIRRHLQRLAEDIKW